MGNQSSNNRDQPQSIQAAASTDRGHDWQPDLSKERPNWRDSHSKQKDASLVVDQNGVYTVKDGDTLYDIARRLLKEKNETVSVSAVNFAVNDIIQQNSDNCPALKSNPELIHPGDQLQLPTSASTALDIPPLPTEQAQHQKTQISDIDGLDSDVRDAKQPEADLQVTPTTIESAPVGQPTADVSAPMQQPASDVSPPSQLAPQLDSAQQNFVSAPAPEVLQPPAPAAATTVLDAQPLPPAAVYASSDDANYPPPPPPQQQDNSDYASAPPVYAQNQNGYYSQPPTGSYTDQEANRLSRMMYDDPHAAADEMRTQIASLDARTAGTLIAKTKGDEAVGGLGDLQIQAEFDQYGRDTGYRNVTMATPDGIEQIAELQSRPPAYYGGNNQGYAGENALGIVAGVIVGDLLWQQSRGLDFNDDRYRGWCNREQGRENYWNNNNAQFVQNWRNSEYRNQYQNQNWQQVINHPTTNNTYITNNRYDTTINNRQVNTTIINETINNTKQIIHNPARQESHIPVGLTGRAPQFPSPVVGHGSERLPQNLPGQLMPNRELPQPEAARERANQQQQQEAARERANQQQQQEAARERANQQQQQEAARERTNQQQQQEAARERANQQQQQEAARERANQQQQQEAARERANQQQQQEAARERAGHEKVVTQPPQHALTNR